MDKDKLNSLIAGLTRDELRSLRGIISGKLGKRTITPEQQAAMQAARMERKATQPNQRYKEKSGKFLGNLEK